MLRGGTWLGEEVRNIYHRHLPSAKGEVIEGSTLKARAICNPASSGGRHEPTELRREIEGYDLEWITTESPGDAREAAKEWREGLLMVVGGDGTISEVVNGLGRAGFPAGDPGHLTGGDRQRPRRHPRHTRGSRRGRGRVAPEPGEDPGHGPGPF